MAIATNNVVTLTYTLHTVKNGEKTFVEQTSNENPLDFLYGVGMMLPKFEENIAGLNVGDKIDFELAPEDAYGEKDERAVAQLPADMFKETGLPPVGEVLPLQDNQGNQFRAVVVEVTPEAVVADLNHPMAGQTLHFEIEILSVRPATEEELSHGHSHGPDGTHSH
ncbi:FKBP-type peptidyl-prolyl cis-trans isomerase [Sphingobacterium spiritivorum]|uniref:Peptidyl-prolyl cis-trans isomerase n=2 Tax=Sphingobacterium spiritivorum TaxID=258 RepID=A0A380BB11_SPHSI|nr:peptidylprolyl isomerase [Sphingobacterium spiritivorum]EEI92638.1 peptidyl-prolyl cis-trans isomerase, FKBP-type [Sphingobacterium spiritivorum ATCC 33300]QQS94171.1 peptidylprolyl isomerase [Sphingobacterium spiritivorum]QQT27088.1 peptidylprolyl isomerase [Sphingobacterium spiritivorum]SUI96858.1 FKBP-type peptidyl-prolyl cis-trans isomerase slyD [Sphingobacterium spiritivorum]